MNGDHFRRRFSADFLHQPRFRPRGPRRDEEKPKAAATPLKKRNAASDSFTALVEEDELYFRLAPSNYPNNALKRTFLDAFREVWERIPVPDRQRMLDYWRERRDYVPGDRNTPLPPHRPIIHLTDSGSRRVEHKCQKFGHELTFCVSPLKEHLAELPATIARILALVVRFANRAHWQLVVEEIENPVTEWEQRQAKVSHAARERKLDTLEAKFRRKHNAAMAELLARWGFGECRAH